MCRQNFPTEKLSKHSELSIFQQFYTSCRITNARHVAATSQNLNVSPVNYLEQRKRNQFSMLDLKFVWFHHVWWLVGKRSMVETGSHGLLNILFSPSIILWTRKMKISWDVLRKPGKIGFTFKHCWHDKFLRWNNYISGARQKLSSLKVADHSVVKT